MNIRGRGHSSWKGDKKPYKIKLDEKLSLMGMPKNKHWALLKFWPPTMAGMKLGELMGMAWTPSTKPIEVVLNGDYIGLYLLTETDVYKRQGQGCLCDGFVCHPICRPLRQ